MAKKVKKKTTQPKPKYKWKGAKGSCKKLTVILHNGKE